MYISINQSFNQIENEIENENESENEIENENVHHHGNFCETDAKPSRHPDPPTTSLSPEGWSYRYIDILIY